MTYAELKRKIQSLGFADNEDMTEYNTVIMDSINQAERLICLTVKPIKGVKMIDLTAVDEEEQPVYTPDEDGFYVIDMGEEVTDFLAWDNKPYIKASGKVIYLNEYFHEEENKLLLNASDGLEKVYVPYKVAPTKITEDTEADFEIELDETVQPLLPLLASYFIWLDDDSTKATLYYNNYDDLKNQILANNEERSTLEFVGGIAWGR